MKETGSIPSEIKARRKLLAGAGLGLLSLLSFFKFRQIPERNSGISCIPPPENKETIKVLSQDGRLVEVDLSKIKRREGKISDEELKNWIRKDKL